ncbi:MAG: hypothetical protein WCR42_02905 [bacterium]
MKKISKNFVIEILRTLVIAFISVFAVDVLWNLLIDKIGFVIDWRMVMSNILIVGIVLSIFRRNNKKKKTNE